MVVVMDNVIRIEPYVISIEFDDIIERIDTSSWVIGADIQIGDKLSFNKQRKNQRKNKNESDNLNGDFMFVVCSPSFKINPSTDYAKDINRAYVQIEFDKDDAINYITNLVNSMGVVSIYEFTLRIRSFLLTDEWDYLNESE